MGGSDGRSEALIAAETRGGYAVYARRYSGSKILMKPLIFSEEEEGLPLFAKKKNPPSKKRKKTWKVLLFLKVKKAPPFFFFLFQSSSMRGRGPFLYKGAFPSPLLLTKFFLPSFSLPHFCILLPLLLSLSLSSKEETFFLSPFDEPQVCSYHHHHHPTSFPSFGRQNSPKNNIKNFP